MKKFLLGLMSVLIFTGITFGQLNGTYNIPGSYPTLADAITDLNTVGVSGNVILNLLAGNSQTAPAGGYVIGSATLCGAGANASGISQTVTITGNSNTITAYAPQTAGALNDGIFKILGADYITIQGFTMQENTANTITTAASNDMTEWGVAVLYFSVTDGAKNITIQNNTITLVRTYQNTFGIYSNVRHSPTAISTAADITNVSGATDNLKIYNNNVSNINNGIVVVGSTTGAYMNTGIDVGGSAAGTANTISNYGTTGTFSGYISVSGSVMGINLNNSLSSNVSYNSVTCPGLNTAGTVYGIYYQASGTLPTTGGPFSNTISHNTLSIKSGLASGAINGINNAVGNSIISYDVSYNDFNNFGHTGSGTGAINVLYSSGAGNVQTINYNTFTNLSVNTTGIVYLLYYSNSMPLATSTQTVNNNAIVTAFNKTGAGGTVYGMYTFASSVTGSSKTVANNNFSNMTVTGATTLYGIRETDGGSPIKSVHDNIVSNLAGGTSAVYGMDFGYGTANYYNNTVNTLTSSGAIYGIQLGSGTNNLYQNSIYALSSSGASAVYGISNSSATLNSIYKNKIYDITGSNASSIIYGIYVSAGTTINTYNNYVSDLKTPNANAAIPLAGIYISGGTTSNVFFNSVYLNASSTGALFGSAALYASTTPTLDMRDNILVNVSTPNGAGVTAAYRRSTTTLTTYSANSNANCFYAGATEDATHAVYYDGTTVYNMAGYKTLVAPRDAASFRELPPFNSVPTNLHLVAGTPTQCESGGLTITSPIAIIDDYDGNTRLSPPDIGADEGTFTPLDLNPPTISYTPLGNTSLFTDRSLDATITDLSLVGDGANLPVLYWKINAAAYTGPVAVFSQIGNIYTFKFGAGVALGDVVSYFIIAQDKAVPPNVGSYPPGAVVSASPPLLTGAGPLAPSAYTIIPAPLAGDYTVGLADFINMTGKNITFEKVVKKVMKEVIVPDNSNKKSANNSVSTGLTLNGKKEIVEVDEISWVPMENGIPYEGPLYVKKSENPQYNFPDGTKGVYATITAAVADLNLRGVSGVTTFSLVDATYPTETFPITIDVTSGDVPTPTNTVTIKPASGINAVISSATATAIFKLNGADYITIDGSNNGTTSQNLTITNTNTALSVAIWIGSKSASNGATFNTVKNCILSGSSPTTTTAGVLIGSGTTMGNAAEAQNSNNTINNNSFTAFQNGVYHSGFTTPDQNINISNNLFGSTIAASKLGYRGMILLNAQDFNIYNNTITGVVTATTSTSTGIQLGNTINGGTIEKNMISDIKNTNTGGYGANGIYLAASSTTSNVTVKNNFIWDVAGYGYSLSGPADNGYGIIATSGGGYNIYFNSVNLNTNQTATTGLPAAINTVGITTASSLNVRNNIFVNSQTVGVQCYAIYSGAATIYADINYNDYFATGANLGYLGANQLDLAAWKVATGKDGFSISGIPGFISPTNLHIKTSSNVVSNNGFYLASVPVDIDLQNRLDPPDIGADEYTYVAPLCDPPLNFAIPSFTYNSATVEWTALSSPVVRIDKGAIGHAPGTGVLVPVATGSPFNLALDPQTGYDIYIQQNCEEYNLYSDWVGPITITTPCAPATSVAENFDAVTTPALPICWRKYTSPSYTLQYVQTTTTSPNSPPNCVVLYSSSATLPADAPLLISPEISNLSIGTYRLRFAAKGASTNTSVIIGTMSDPLNAATFTTFQTISGLSTTTWGNYLVSFASYSGTDKYIAFKHPLTTTSSYIYVDDVNWEPATPLLVANPNAVSCGYGPNGGYSAEKTYTLSGFDLTGYPGNIVVTATANFEVSLTTLVGFSNTVNVPFTGASLSATVFVRCAPTAPNTYYNGTITNVGGGSNCTVTVTGNSDIFVSYCPSNATSAGDEDIFNVTVGTLNNTSNCSTTGGPGSILNQYSNYLSLTPPDLQQGTGNAFSVTSGTCGGNYGNAFKIFIDCNQDGDFADAGEQVYVSPASTTGPHSETGSITLPPGTVSGITIMRVICVETSTPSSITACGTYTWGETEDYKVNIGLPPTCPAPWNLTTTGVTGTSAILNWTNGGSELLWNVKYGAPGFDPLTQGTLITGITTHPYTLNPTTPPLTPNTPYDWYVRADCGGGDISYWSSKMTFTTLCPAQTVPITENFDGVTVPNLPNCWLKKIVSTSSAVVQTSTTYYNSLPNSLYMSNSGDAAAIALLISPQVSGLLTNKMITFYAKSSSDGYTVIVGAMGDPGDETTFLPVSTITLSTTFTQYTVYYNLGVGSNDFVAFKHGLGGTYRSIYLDDIQISLKPSCPPPTNLTTTEVTGTTVKLDWTSNGVETLWDVVYGAPGFDPATAGILITGISAHPYVLNPPLVPNTPYDWFVRADCGTDAVSTWSARASFTTGQIPATLPYSITFESGMSDWTIVNGTQTNKWFVGTATAYAGTQSVYVSDDNGVNNNYNSTGYVASVVHFYRDVTFPAGPGNLVLDFWWKAQGEGTTTLYDYLRVFLVETSVLPVAGTQLTTGQIGTSYNLQGTTWQHVTLTLSAANLNTTKRLVFSWRNDSSFDFPPAAAVDNISLTLVPPPLASVTPASFSKSITANATATDNLSIGNTGGSTLNYFVSMPGNNVSVFQDNFDSYLAGQQLACQVPAVWTTWSNLPCDAIEDPYISSTYAYSGTNSVKIVTDNDLVKTYGGLLSGKYSTSFQMFIPTGKAGYVNALSNFVVGTKYWAFDCYFNVGGSGHLDANHTTTNFAWVPNVWQKVEFIVDLDHDIAEFWIGGSFVYSWPWTQGNSTGTGPLIIDAFDFFGATVNDEMYVDDYKVEQIQPFWLTLNASNASIAGTVNVGDPADAFIVGFNSAGLAVGTYTANIQVATNDVVGLYTIPVTLIVRLPIVSGNVYYGPTGIKAMSTLTTVTLTPGPTVSTGTGGVYLLTNVLDGVYDIKAQTTKPYNFSDAVAANDALLISRYVLGNISLTTVQKRAGDVNFNNDCANNDGLLIKRRVLGNINAWPAPNLNWVFATPGNDMPFGSPTFPPINGPKQITISGSDVTVELRMLETGDVNGTWTPPNE